MATTQHKQSNTGIWIFLSVLLVVATAVALFFYYDNSRRAEQINREQQAKEDAQKAQDEKLRTDYLRGECLDESDKEYWSYIKLNSINTRQTKDGPVYTAPQSAWDRAADTKKQATDKCYREYPTD